MKTFTLAIRITTVVALSLLMVQCGNKQAAPNQSVSDDTTISSYGDKLPIAYINVDSLLSKYNYAKDLNEKMINKQENARASINEKARQLKKEQDDFQRKYQNNALPKEPNKNINDWKKRLPTCKNMLKDWKTKICWNSKKC